MPSAMFWKKPGKMAKPIHERLLTRSTVGRSGSWLPKLAFSQRFTAPIGLPMKGTMSHHAPAVVPFSPIQSERSEVMAPRRSIMRPSCLRSIQRIMNIESMMAAKPTSEVMSAPVKAAMASA